MSAAHRLKWLHLGLMVGWALLIPVSYLTGWIYQVWFVNLLSLVALILASFAAYQATRAEVKVDHVADIKADEVNVERADEVNR